METVPFAPEVRILMAEVETLMSGCVTWTLGQKRFGEPRPAHHLLLPPRIIRFQRRQRTAHLMFYTEALKNAQRKSVETTIRKMASPLCEDRTVQCMNNERLDSTPGNVRDHGSWGESGTRPNRK